MPRVGVLPGTAGGARRGAKQLGLTVEEVTVNVTLLGGAFGRKSKPGLRGRSGGAVEGGGRPASQGRGHGRMIQH